MQESIMRCLLGAGLWMTLAASAGAQDGPPAGSVEHGRQLFMANTCYSCHGTAGQGAERTGPKLAPDPFPYVAFALQLRQPRGTMPRYPKQVLSDQDVADIYAFVSSVPASPAVDGIRLLDAFKVAR